MSNGDTTGKTFKGLWIGPRNPRAQDRQNLRKSRELAKPQPHGPGSSKDDAIVISENESEGSGKEEEKQGRMKRRKTSHASTGLGGQL